MRQCRRCSMAAVAPLLQPLSPTRRSPCCCPGPDGIFAALAVHLAHKARGVAVEMRPNTVYAPLTVDTLNLKVRSGVVGEAPALARLCRQAA